MMLQGDRARGGVEIRARGVGWDSGPGAGWGFGAGRGVGWGFGPGRGVGWGFGPERGVGWGFEPRRGVGIFLVRWEIFYLFAVFSPFG